MTINRRNLITFIKSSAFGILDMNITSVIQGLRICFLLKDIQFFYRADKNFV